MIGQENVGEVTTIKMIADGTEMIAGIGHETKTIVVTEEIMIANTIKRMMKGSSFFGPIFGNEGIFPPQN